MKKLLLPALFLLTLTTAKAQYTIDMVKDGDDFTFPVVQGNSRAIDKINTILRLEILGNVQDTCVAMKTIGPSPNRPTGAYMLHIHADNNNERILTFYTDAEYCGASCDYYVGYHAFDAQTGEEFTTRDLFTADGYEQLSEMARVERIEILYNAIARCDMYKEGVEDALTDERDPEMIESLQNDLEVNKEEREIYERCIETINSETSLGQFNINDEDEVFNLIRERCSSHYNRGIDDVGRIRTTYSYSQIRPFLSAYGRKIIFGEKNEALPTDLRGKLFEGTIAGKYPIKLLMERSHEVNSLGGRYYYERVGQGIELSGKLEGDKLTLREYNEDYKKNGTFDLTLNESRTKATGTWKSADGKVLNVELHRNL